MAHASPFVKVTVVGAPVCGAFQFLMTQFGNPNEMQFFLNFSESLTCEIAEGYDGCLKSEMRPAKKTTQN